MTHDKIAYNECLYGYMGRFEYVSILDIDEVTQFPTRSKIIIRSISDFKFKSCR